MSVKHWSKTNTGEIVFPLGGIGSGCIGLAGNGHLVDWELAGRPNKGTDNGLSHFAIKAETADGSLIDARVLQGDHQPPYMGNYSHNLYSGYGFGPARTTMAGLPHFSGHTFYNEFPFARIALRDKAFPAQVSLTGFSPFIPLEPDDSGLPAAFFEVALKNHTNQAITYTVCLSVTNPAPAGHAHHSTVGASGWAGVQLGNTSGNRLDDSWGELVIATDCHNHSCQNYWYRGSWFDSLNMLWKEFTSPKPLSARQYDEPSRRPDTAAVTASVTLEPGHGGSLRFLIAWRFPNRHNYWCAMEPPNNTGYFLDPRLASTAVPDDAYWLNHYATRFATVTAIADYCWDNLSRLRHASRLFGHTIAATRLPPVMLEAVVSNLAILRSSTCMRLPDGSFYGFEGLHSHCGSCEGNCTHVWAYEYALAFLFPSLERSMRELTYNYCIDPDGGIYFRLQLPLQKGRFYDHRPCADGQLADIVETYREWKLCGDDHWLRSVWESVKLSLEYAWSPANPDRWDPEQSGVIHGRQHNTLDLEMFGPNGWISGLYLTALQAAAEMAEAMQQPELAVQYRALCERGRTWVAQNLFNGEHYIQQLDLGDRMQLTGYKNFRGRADDDAVKRYWNTESNQIKYQMGDGCFIDQLLGEWHGRLCGIGPILPDEQVQSSLQSILRYNYRPSIRETFNPCRLYALNDEGGTVLCGWSDDRPRPDIPALYTDEVWSGCEYQFASNLLLHGYTQAAEQVVRTLRDRYDGNKRNPFGEMECGSSYARSLASYALLLAYSGFRFDARKGYIGFFPNEPRAFTSFWSTDSGWGLVRFEPDRIILKLEHGKLSLSCLGLPIGLLDRTKRVKLGRHALNFSILRDLSMLQMDTQLQAGNRLICYLADIKEE